MPLPTPDPGESKQEFVSRCIEILTKYESERFPTREQRAAICYSQWGETPEEKEAAHEKSQERKTMHRS